MRKERGRELYILQINDLIVSTSSDYYKALENICFTDVLNADL